MINYLIDAKASTGVNGNSDYGDPPSARNPDRSVQYGWSAQQSPMTGQYPFDLKCAIAASSA
jgi:hypothetical protein